MTVNSPSTGRSVMRTAAFQRKGSMGEALHEALAGSDQPPKGGPSLKIVIGQKEAADPDIPAGETECPKCGTIFNVKTGEIDKEATAKDVVDDDTEDEGEK